MTALKQLDLEEIRGRLDRAMAWIRSGRPVGEVTGAPSVLLTVAAVPDLLAELDRLQNLMDDVYRDGYRTGFMHAGGGDPYKQMENRT